MCYFRESVNCVTWVVDRDDELILFSVANVGDVTASRTLTAVGVCDHDVTTSGSVAGFVAHVIRKG